MFWSLMIIGWFAALVVYCVGIVGTGKPLWFIPKSIKKRWHELPYRRLTSIVATYDGEVYSHVRPLKAGPHICRNKIGSEGDGAKGMVWICECGRMYWGRNEEHDSYALTWQRKYWWRIRPWLPWSLPHYIIAARIRRGKSHLRITKGGEL